MVHGPGRCPAVKVAAIVTIFADWQGFNICAYISTRRFAGPAAKRAAREAKAQTWSQIVDNHSHTAIKIQRIKCG